MMPFDEVRPSAPLGQVSKQTGFLTADDPVEAYLKALQVFVTAPETRVWDEPTHDALWAWWQANVLPRLPAGEATVAPAGEVPAFGADPDRAANAAVRPLLEAKDEALFDLYAPLLALLGVPSGSRDEYVAYMEAHVDAVNAAMGQVQDSVRAAETAAAPALPVPPVPPAPEPELVPEPETLPTVVARRSFAWVWWLVGAAAVVGAALWWPREKKE